MDLSKMVSNVLHLAETFSPLLAGTPAGPIIAAGKAVLDLVDDVRHVAASDDVPALNAARDRLEPLVMAHLNRTIDSLG
jgi:hypothetical protein